MFYEYACNKCGLAYETQTFARIGEAIPDRTCECGGDLIRAVSLFNCTPVALNTPYFNHTVGEYVTGTRDFERKLRDGQRRMSERLGYEQSFAPIYPSERQHHVESTASNDGQHGESVERYARIRNETNDKRTIIC
jgi:hypothetical protein